MRACVRENLEERVKVQQHPISQGQAAADNGRADREARSTCVVTHCVWGIVRCYLLSCGACFVHSCERACVKRKQEREKRRERNRAEQQNDE